MRFQPSGSRVLLKKDVETVTASGIFLPGDSKKKIDTGIVVAVGPGMLRPDGAVQPCLFKENDKVLFNVYAATEVQVENKSYLLLNESDIFGNFVS